MLDYKKRELQKDNYRVILEQLEKDFREFLNSEGLRILGAWVPIGAYTEALTRTNGLQKKDKIQAWLDARPEIRFAPVEEIEIREVPYRHLNIEIFLHELDVIAKRKVEFERGKKTQNTFSEQTAPNNSIFSNALAKVKSLLHLQTHSAMESKDKNIARDEVVKVKCGAVDMARLELCGLIDWGYFAKQYFDKDTQWISNKFQNCTYGKILYGFSEEEYVRFSSALNDLASRLQKHAKEISEADMYFEE